MEKNVISRKNKIIYLGISLVFIGLFFIPSLIGNLWFLTNPGIEYCSTWDSFSHTCVGYNFWTSFLIGLQIYITFITTFVFWGLIYKIDAGLSNLKIPFWVVTILSWLHIIVIWMQLGYS